MKIMCVFSWQKLPVHVGGHGMRCSCWTSSRARPCLGPRFTSAAVWNYMCFSRLCGFPPIFSGCAAKLWKTHSPGCVNTSGCAALPRGTPKQVPEMGLALSLGILCVTTFSPLSSLVVHTGAPFVVYRAILYDQYTRCAFVVPVCNHLCEAMFELLLLVLRCVGICLRV